MQSEKTITTMHGVFINVFNVGVLLTGKSGIGKSELALSLIQRNHALIADDCVELKFSEGEGIIGYCPSLLQDFLEVRGLGILNIREMYGDSAIALQKKLALIIDVVNFTQQQLNQIDRLYGIRQQENIFDISIPRVIIPVTTGRNLAVLVEAAVKNQMLKNDGYDASLDFINQQSQQTRNIHDS